MTLLARVPVLVLRNFATQRNNLAQYPAYKPHTMAETQRGPTMLKSVLNNIRCARDVSQLFVELGYTAAESPYDDEATVVARWKGFQVIAVDASAPRERARALARSLAGCSARALAVAVGAPNEIALTAPRLGAPGVNRLLVVPLDNPSPATLQHLERFRPRPSSNGLAHALRVEELLATEIAGERFYAAFRVVLERMAASLGNDGTASDRRMAALLPLTRLLFLYFVQAKGWLDHNPDYLPMLLDDALATRRHFHRSFLNPLFFEMLNRPPALRRQVDHLGRIPYLNGGLFQQYPVEQRLRAVFSNAVWRDVFTRLFERFRFCVREADEVDAIAPDMLGHVFERVMEPGTRLDTGTFYTPETVVRQMVDAAIETSLGDGDLLTHEQVARIVRCEQIDAALRSPVRRRLHRLRILDPAVGSGAFLLGALECLCTMHLALEGNSNPRRRLQLRQRILRDNLFGVDLNPVAVRLAELRLWLAVIADDPTTEIDRIEPLPNLDGVIRQGDSILDPIASTAALGGDIRPVPAPSAQGRAVAKARAALFAARGTDQPPAIARLRSAEQSLAELLLNRLMKQVEDALRDLAGSARSRDLFGNRSGFSTAQRRFYVRLRAHRRALRSALTATRDGVVPFFSFEVHAPETMRAGGFSIVIGNPRWVRAERIPVGMRNTLNTRFSLWRCAKARGFSHLPDLSIAFLQRALELAAPGGTVALLMPSKVATAGYGEAVRSHLVRETTLSYIHRVPEAEAARFGATTYPLAVVLRNRPPKARHSVRLGFGAATTLRQSSLARAGPWILVPDPLRSAIEEFRGCGVPLGQIAPPALGLKTGADRILVGQVVQRLGRLSRVRFCDEVVEIEASLLRPIVRGRDVRPFTATSVKIVFWGYDGTGQVRKSLPPRAAAYAATHKRPLTKRADYHAGPLWTLFRLPAVLAKHRVVWSDISRRPTAVALDHTVPNPSLPLNSCYVSSAPNPNAALVISAVMNSSFAGALIAATADEARGGYHRVNARVAAELPVPGDTPGSDALALLSRQYHNSGEFNQDDLDEAVAEALGLGPTAADRLRRYARLHC